MKVFIIDDDQLSIFLTQSMLELENVTQSIHTFQSASDALDALHACSENTMPDVVFLDLNMPIMDGWNFLTAIAPLKQRIGEDKCCIYILTSSLDVADITRSKEYPFVSGFLHKPLSSEDISHIYNQYTQRQQNKG